MSESHALTNNLDGLRELLGKLEFYKPEETELIITHASFLERHGITLDEISFEAPAVLSLVQLAVVEKQLLSLGFTEANILKISQEWSAETISNLANLGAEATNLLKLDFHRTQIEYVAENYDSTQIATLISNLQAAARGYDKLIEAEHSDFGVRMLVLDAESPAHVQTLLDSISSEPANAVGEVEEDRVKKAEL